MSRVITIEDQIRESRRGPRIVEESPSDFLAFFGEKENIPAAPLYEKQLEASVSKMISVSNWQFVSPPDPFSLSLRDFLSLELDEAQELLIKVYGLCKDLLEKAWERGVRQAVICNGKIVFESKDIEDISNETVERLAKEYDKACYVFSAPDAVEESIWTSVGDNDFYPTLCMYLGTVDSDESEIVNNSSPICADLDTGNPSYKIFNANQLAGSLAEFTPIQMRRGEHLGQTYIYFPKKLKMCVRDLNGNINSIVCSVRLVKDWNGSALLQASPNRVGYIGRDVLRDLRIRLKLDPLEKITQIIDVS